MSKRREWIATCGLVAATAVWGLTFVTVQDAVRIFPVLTFLGYRFSASAGLLALVYLPDLRRMSLPGLMQGVWMGMCLSAGFILQTYGLTVLSVPTVAFITGLFVVFTPLLGLVALHRRPSRLTWWAIIPSAVGLYFLTGGQASWGAGDLVVLGGAIAFAGQILTTERGVERYPFGGLVVVEMAICGAVSFIGAMWEREVALPSTSTVWEALVVTAVLAGAFAFSMQTAAQRHLSSARTAIIMTLEPAFAALFAYVLLGTNLTPSGWVGAILVMSAVFIVEILPRLDAEAPKRQMEQ